MKKTKGEHEKKNDKKIQQIGTYYISTYIYVGSYLYYLSPLLLTIVSFTVKVFIRGTRKTVIIIKTNRTRVI